MAETQTKRHRQDDTVPDTKTTKRHKDSYINEQETTQDLLDLFTSLSSGPFLDFCVLTQQPEPGPNTNNNINDNNNPTLTTNDDEKESVIRHLLEASDDELGIPSRVVESADDCTNVGGDVDGGDIPVAFDGLWELEDEAANYYTLLQSELFMQ